MRNIWLDRLGRLNEQLNKILLDRPGEKLGIEWRDEVEKVIREVWNYSKIETDIIELENVKIELQKFRKYQKLFLTAD